MCIYIYIYCICRINYSRKGEGKQCQSPYYKPPDTYYSIQRGPCLPSLKITTEISEELCAAAGPFSHGAGPDTEKQLCQSAGLGWSNVLACTITRACPQSSLHW